MKNEIEIKNEPTLTELVKTIKAQVDRILAELQKL